MADKSENDSEALEVAADILRPLGHYFDVSLEHLDRLPEGGVLLVGNHALLGIDSVVLLPELFRQTGRRPRGLALRSLFRVPVLRDALNEVGLVEGSRQNAIELLGADEMVITYPGGARDSIKGRHRRYELQWGDRRGFAHVALEAGVPVVPVAGIGPDDAFPTQSNEGIFSMPFLGDKSYKVPFFLPIARPVPFAFRFGEPIEPPERFVEGDAEPDEQAAGQFARRVEQDLQSMLDEGQTSREPLFEVLSGLLDRLKGG